GGQLTRAAAAGDAPATPRVRGGAPPPGPPPRLWAAARAGQPVPGRTDPADPDPAHADQRAGSVRGPAAGPGPAAAAAGADRGRRQRRAQSAVRPLLLRLRRAPAGGPPPRRPGPPPRAPRPA